MKKLRKAYIGLIMAFLYAPIVLLILYSFNDSKSRAQWGGFTLRWYRELFADQAIMSALGTTLSIGLLAAAISTVLGTVGAIALFQMKRRPRQAMMSIVNLPMLNSEVVTGVSLMLLYAMARIQLGYLTLLLSHIAFCVPYVVLSVLPKLRQLDPQNLSSKVARMFSACRRPLFTREEWLLMTALGRLLLPLVKRIIAVCCAVTVFSSLLISDSRLGFL